MHIAGAVHRPHPAETDNLLDQVPFGKRNPCLELALTAGILFAAIVIRKFGE
jgi:hypothetical protein